MFRSRVPRGGQQSRRPTSSANANDDDEEEVVLVKKARTNVGAPSLLAASTAARKSSTSVPRSTAEIAGGSYTARSEDREVSLGASARGGSYSAEELARLRSQQLFRAKTEEAELAEGIELSGEEAEFAQQKIEEASAETEFLDEKTEFQRRLKLKIAAISKKSAVERSQVDEKRIFVSERVKDAPAEFVHFQETDEAGEEWEQEIVKRGLRITAMDNLEDIALHKLNELSSGRATEIRQTYRRTVESIDDIQLSLAEAMNALRENLARNGRRLETVASDVASLQSEESALRAQLEKRIALVNDVREFRLHCADLVAMLREKSPLVTDLRAAVVTLRSELTSRLIRSRVVHQEDLIFRVKQAGLLIQLGSSYTPSAVLVGSNDSTLVSVEGRETSIEEREQLAGQFAHFRDDEHGRIEAFGIYTSSEDEETYSRRMAELTAAHAMVFEEARHEICDVEAILTTMQSFLTKHPEQFAVSYIAHSLVGLLEPLVLHDICLLDFLNQEVDLETRSWYNPVRSFDAALDAELTSSAFNDTPRLLPQVKQAHTPNKQKIT